MRHGPQRHASPTLDGHLSNDHSSLTVYNPQPSNSTPRSCCQQEQQATPRPRGSSCPYRTDTLSASCIDQPASASATSAAIKFKVEAFYKSEEAPRAETSMYVLRPAKPDRRLCEGFACRFPVCAVAYDMPLFVASITGCFPWTRV